MHGHATLSEVYACEVPSIYELITSEVRGDIRCNLLGLPAVDSLDILQIGEAREEQ